MQEFAFNFPAHKITYLEEPNVYAQLLSVMSEVDEAKKATFSSDKWEITLEILDIIHAAESALRMLEVEEKTIDVARLAVIQKNKESGYYDNE